jgi:hypothetical protein
VKKQQPDKTITCLRRRNMLFERIESKGPAHYSYLVGDGKEAIVIDPRRDCGVYGHVLETHRPACCSARAGPT